MRLNEISQNSCPFFHGTDEETAKFLSVHGFGTDQREKGIAPGAPEDIRKLTFLTPSRAGARWYAENNLRFKDGVVIEVS